jgi:hypothetical protein
MSPNDPTPTTKARLWPSQDGSSVTSQPSAAVARVMFQFPRLLLYRVRIKADDAKYLSYRRSSRPRAATVHRNRAVTRAPGYLPMDGSEAC